MKQTKLLLLIPVLVLGIAISLNFIPRTEQVQNLNNNLESIQSSELQSKEKAKATAENSNQDFVVQELSQLSSPFTKERVIALNAIVQKSLDLINEFDASRKTVKLSNESQSKSFLAKLDELAVKSAAVRKEMELAGMDLKNSGEKYNKPIFAAMVNFVNEVDQEIRKESLLLSQNVVGLQTSALRIGSQTNE